MDQIYIDKVLAGDSHCFRYFLKTYKDMAYSVAMSVLKQEHLAEEVVQDAFMMCYQSLNKFKGHSKFSTWFYRIVVNCAFGELRKSKHTLVEFDIVSHDTSFDENAFSILVQKERDHLIQEALLLLPSKESLALRLFYLEDLSIKEIVEITGWTETNIKTILHRSRKQLYQVLSKLMKEEYYGA